MQKPQFISILLLCVLGCTRESFPPCQIDIEMVNYPFIAHSHNDYEQKHPITTAINHGFSSLEVDVAFDGSDIKVSHDEKNLDEKPGFENSYLKPLIANYQRESGTILLVDIKNYSEELIDKLNLILNQYEDNIVSRNNPDQIENKIKIILSGEIPRQTLINDTSNKHLFIDGRLNNIDLSESTVIVPIISIKISDISNSDADNEEEIQKVVKQVHDQNKMIRFWNTNDKESVWLKLIKLKVDIIGVDDIEHFCGAMKANDFIG